MSLRSLIFLGLACLPLSACVAANGEVTSADPPLSSESAFDASAFVPSGFVPLRVVRGDLNADGAQDALVVATRLSEDSDALSAPRALSIVMSRPDGTYTLSAVNTRLAACATCGGRFGDGLVVATIKDGKVLVVNEGGGARYGWSNEYTFEFDFDGERWMLQAYRAVVSSQPDQQFKRIDQSPTDFGERSFESLTREDLPVPKLD